MYSYLMYTHDRYMLVCDRSIWCGIYTLIVAISQIWLLVSLLDTMSRDVECVNRMNIMYWSVLKWNKIVIIASSAVKIASIYIYIYIYIYNVLGLQSHTLFHNYNYYSTWASLSLSLSLSLWCFDVGHVDRMADILEISYINSTFRLMLNRDAVKLRTLIA